VAVPVTSSTLPFKTLPVAVSLLAGFLLVGGLLFGFHYSVDRFGVYRSEGLNFVDHIAPNIYFHKFRHLLQSGDTHACLVMGSSRVAAIDSAALDEDCFNANHPYGSLAKNLALLSALVRAGKAPQIVYLGLDDASYTLADKNSAGSRGPASGPIEAQQFHADYLLRYPQWVDMDIFSGKLPRADKPWLALQPEVELPQLREKETAFAADVAAHDRKFIDLRATIWGKEDLIEPSLGALRDIQALAIAEGIRLVVFINPMHYMTYLKIDQDLFEHFRRELVTLMPFVDFSGLHAFSQDNRYWAETSHYTPGLGDHIAACLLGAHTEPADFCRRIDADNIDQALAQQLRDDQVQLFASPVFDGATSLPRRLGEFLLAISGADRRDDSSELVSGLKFKNFNVVKLPYLHTDSVDPQIIIRNTCFESQQKYLLQMDLDYVQTQTLFFYSPTPKGRYSRKRRDRLDLDAGRHQIHVLVRGLSCDDYLRFDPAQRRSDFFLRSILQTPLKGMREAQL
jgi:hypothetical protein